MYTDRSVSNRVIVSAVNMSATSDCLGIIEPIVNIVTPSDPAFSVRYPCSGETIYGPVKFEVYRLYYTFLGASAYAVSFFIGTAEEPQFVFSRSLDNRLVIDFGIGGIPLTIGAYGDTVGEFGTTIVDVVYPTAQYSFALLVVAPFLRSAKVNSNSVTTLLNYTSIGLLDSATPFLMMQSSAGVKQYHPAERYDGRKTAGPTERCNTFRPRITINEVSTIDEQNFGEALYTVLDSEEYSDTVTCQSTLIGDSWKSVFSTFPEINPVVRGKGCSLQQKFRSLIEHYNLSISMNVFTKNMATWSLLKYILGRLLYGDFDLKYLSACFHTQFLRDLSRSRFSAFSRVFDALAKYNRYFKCVAPCECRTHSVRVSHS